MHKIKASDGRSEEALRERRLDERETTWTEQRRVIDDSNLTTAAVRSGKG